MGIFHSKSNAKQNKNQCGNITASNTISPSESQITVKNAFKTNLQQDENVVYGPCQYNGDSDTLNFDTKTQTSMLATDQKGSIVWDPITSLYELCVARRLGEPEFEFRVTVTPTKRSASHVHTVRCVVKYDSVVFQSEGIAGKKSTAKRIAATAVYEDIVGRQLENRLVNAAVLGRPTDLYRTDEHVDGVDSDWSLETAVTTSLGTVEESQAVGKDLSKGDEQRDDAADCDTLKSGGSDTLVSDGTMRPCGDSIRTDILIEKQWKSPAGNPITEVQQLCSYHKWKAPEFECSVIKTATANSMLHRHTAKCLVQIDDKTFCAEGVAGNKKAAKRLAAMKVYSEITECLNGRSAGFMISR